MLIYTEILAQKITGPKLLKPVKTSFKNLEPAICGRTDTLKKGEFETKLPGLDSNQQPSG